MSDHSHETNKEALATRYSDLLSEQADARELQLFDDLETLYASARVPEHLTFAQVFPESMNARQTWEQSIGPGIPPAISPKRRVVNMRRRRWLNRLNALAAVLIAAALVGSLLIVTHMVQRSQQENSQRIRRCNDLHAHKSTAWLSSLQKMNITTGWAYGIDHTTNQNRVLHTTDGGTTWQDVTPLLNGGTTGISQGTASAGEAYFLNVCSAWVALAQPNNAPALLFRTTNGGLTWQQSTLPGNQVRGIDFIDARVGWLMMDVLKNGKFSEEDFYHSVDGGQQWTKVAVSSPGTDNQPGALPFVNGTNNITFLNATTGWVTGDSMIYGPRLFITHDGGRTWHQQVLPAPTGNDSRIFKSGTVVWQPQFFSASDGILPVSFWAADSLDVYVTHDGGSSWQSTSMLRIPMPPAIDVSAPTPGPTFVDVNHGWVSGWGEAPLYATSDGGKHWTKVIPRPNLQYIALYNYDFVTSKIGWAIGIFTGKSPGPVRPMLYKTEDGGKTWTFIKPE